MIDIVQCYAALCIMLAVHVMLTMSNYASFVYTVDYQLGSATSGPSTCSGQSHTIMHCPV